VGRRTWAGGEGRREKGERGIQNAKFKCQSSKSVIRD